MQRRFRDRLSLNTYGSTIRLVISSCCRDSTLRNEISACFRARIDPRWKCESTMLSTNKSSGRMGAKIRREYLTSRFVYKAIVIISHNYSVCIYICIYLDLYLVISLPSVGEFIILCYIYVARHISRWSSEIIFERFWQVTDDINISTCSFNLRWPCENICGTSISRYFASKIYTMFNILILMEFRRLSYIDRGKKYTEVAANFRVERNCRFNFEISIWNKIK